MQTTEVINRRKFDRFSFKDTFVLESENFQVISSTSSKNMSRHGAHLISSKPMIKGTIISIEIPSQNLQLMGEIRWVGPENHSHLYEVGVAFHEFFPSTKTRISHLIEKIQDQPDDQILTELENNVEGPAFSFELENKISAFLDKYIQNIRPEPLVFAPISHRRLGTPTENALSFYTPSKPRAIEGGTTSFRIEDQKTSFSLPIRPMLLGMLAISLFFFRNTFTDSLMRWTGTSTPTVVLQVKETTPTAPQDNIENQVVFQEGAIEKIEWSGTSDRFRVKFFFRNEIQANQVKVSKISFDEHPRQLIKITGVVGGLDQKNILVGHSLINKIRLGIHEDNSQKDLHIVMDMTTPHVSVTSTEQDSKSLTLRMVYSGIH